MGRSQRIEVRASRAINIAWLQPCGCRGRTPRGRQAHLRLDPASCVQLDNGEVAFTLDITGAELRCQQALRTQSPVPLRGTIISLESLHAHAERQECSLCIVVTEPLERSLPR